MVDLKLIPASEIPDALDCLLELHRLCYSHYVGVLPSERAFLAWYLERPGCGPENIFVIVDGDTAVSAVFLTLTSFRLGSEYHPMGIIDTVMTHPEYRKRGLASRLMNHSETVMRQAGCRFGYLYTILGSSPFALYEKLGYRDHKRVFHLLKQSQPGPEPSGPVSRFEPADHQAFLNRSLDRVNGFITLDQTMWSWRKLNRPISLPAVLHAGGNGAMRSTLTVSSGKVTTGLGDWKTAAFLSDWAGQTPEDLEYVLHQALSTIAPEVTIDTLCPIDNQEEWDILLKNGFEPVTAESAMLLPLDADAAELMDKNREGKWYPLIESVVGI